MKPQKQAVRLESVYVVCRWILGEKTWEGVLAAMDEQADMETFPGLLQKWEGDNRFPDFIYDLARIEKARMEASSVDLPDRKELAKTIVNPSLCLIPVSWKGLDTFFSDDVSRTGRPLSAGAHILVWRHPATGALHTREATDMDLLALKITVEDIAPEAAAHMGNVDTESIQSVLYISAGNGILVAPPSRIKRVISPRHPDPQTMAPFLSADMFTLQWHITQSCDLHCRHCYDRTSRPSLPTEKALSLLDEMERFCRHMHVHGQVTFTGGNPLLHPDFTKLYRSARDRGFALAILGNPTPMVQIEEILAIAMPRFFQVSLEGLEKTNDYIRGKGHFQRTLQFLDQLKTRGVYTMVMLTLTRDNMDQVLPLGGLLRHRADSFTFNRLSTVGEGAGLLMPDPDDYKKFLHDYTAAAKENAVLRLKDNLINIVRWEAETECFGGCTGYGCGAAFNFLALLPDGEVHACRKYPSPVGDVRTTSLHDIYHSPIAEAYRQGSEACRDCRLSPVCRGCPAITYSCKLDVFKDRDPFCFMP